MPNKKCCVPNCAAGKQILHRFPNPTKYPNRFRDWLYNIGGDILALENDAILKLCCVCHIHFDSKYHTCNKKLTVDAVPTLFLKERRAPLQDITNEAGNSNTTTEIMTSQEPMPDGLGSQKAENFNKPTQLHLKNKTATTQKNQKHTLAAKIKNMQKKNDSYKMRLKKALNLSTNINFQKALNKFKTLAAIFTVMQFREISKPKMARRFSKDEKIMALSLYKVGPKAYRWLSKIFVLPSPVTLSRMITNASLKPGINENIFNQLKKRVTNMKPDERLCTLVFDEMSLTPHFDYSPRKDAISGFVNYKGNPNKKIADHVMVFMIRGIMKNYKQAIYYSFCSGSTPKPILAAQIKEIIRKLQSIGFNVLATICDQGTSNTSAINLLIDETKIEYFNRGESYTSTTFEIDGKEIIPLYDVPHLLKGMRNNLITKDLKFKMDGKEKVAKWEHITQLYENNPTYKGLKMIKNLTENHCNKDKIAKMKVKFASQLFSQTVGKTMGYLAEHGILSKEAEDTADFILFMDNLFDSLNGSQENSRVRSGKELLLNVTPKSAHNNFWNQATEILATMKFVSNKGNAGTVPSIKNWIKTINNMCILKEKLFNVYNIKSFWCRHLNQDPLENFFGSIRSHGLRNNSPTCAGFEAAFASLLVTNMSSNYSRGSNCEEDFCTVFECFNALFFHKKKMENADCVYDIEIEDMSTDMIVDYDMKKKDPRIIAQLEYVTGYILRKCKKIFKNCQACKECLFSNDLSHNTYILQREYLKTKAITDSTKIKRYLCYPHQNLTKCFSEIQDVLHHILRSKSNMSSIKSYMKTLLYTNIGTSFLKCQNHQKDLIDFIFEFSSKFYVTNWAKWTNKILNGTSTSKDVDTNDMVQKLALAYYCKRRKNKK